MFWSTLGRILEAGREAANRSRTGMYTLEDANLFFNVTNDKKVSGSRNINRLFLPDSTTRVTPE